ncbi:hypothetical protein A2943_03010 [Candidatus Adlerbacteria bacterium RIFCSPLOWO2_01_FULL_51_16]|uniref:Uncharacterized protein n=1 Tax=Candidatus Adlerbacteria bacterium RIFCSPLOWO2_01_FULL_51_16 TaxID=1797243 RepID=A0A1F4XGM3_9BACT|nr:MAG: hypothetical protein A2943_03010 [Candidatus Adlerbacteria bacterium RIFCSPLOWO2_01_FULL_51_16]
MFLFGRFFPSQKQKVKIVSIPVEKEEELEIVLTRATNLTFGDSGDPQTFDPKLNPHDLSISRHK